MGPDFQRLFDAAPGLQLVLAPGPPTFTVLSANNAFLRAAGRERTELVGRPVFDALVADPEGAAAMRASLHRALERRIPDELPVQGHDGVSPGGQSGGRGQRYFRAVNTPVLDDEGEVLWVIYHVQDETEQVHLRQEAAELREREALLRSVINHLPQTLVYQLEAESTGARRFTYVSDAVISMFGCTPERATADANAMYEKISGEDRERVARQEAAALQALTPFKAEIRAQGPSGQVSWIYVASAPRRRDDGTVIWDGVMADVTDRKQAEAALREANARLLDADQHKNEFLAVLSHELRGPLAPIRNSVYILEHATPGGEQSTRARQVIDRQAEHLTRLIDDLLDITRISRGKVNLQRERVDLNALVEGTAEDHRDLFARNGVALKHLGAGEPLFVSADPTRLAQVIGNLLTNAAKFTPRSGTTVLTVEADVPRGQVVIRVRDTGAGIAPQTLQHLFEPFVQAAQTLDRSRGGLGLGLTLVRGLVEMHGGTVTARSAGEGLGAEFTVTLPLLPPGVSETEMASASEGPCRGRRVLVIDDDVDAAQSLREALEIGGHEVAVAYSGPEGLEVARRYMPQVVICDIGLPGMGGHDVARALRTAPEAGLRATQLIALSGYALPEDVERSKGAGFDRHLAKPPNIEALERLLAGASAETRRS